MFSGRCFVLTRLATYLLFFGLALTVLLHELRVGLRLRMFTIFIWGLRMVDFFCGEDIEVFWSKNSGWFVIDDVFCELMQAWTLIALLSVLADVNLCQASSLRRLLLLVCFLDCLLCRFCETRRWQGNWKGLLYLKLFLLGHVLIGFCLSCSL